MDESIKEKLNKAAKLVKNADAIIFMSGAGLGVGSGLGTFRGVAAGVWPPLTKHPELDFTDMSNPKWFHKPQGNSALHTTANFGYAFWAYRFESYTSAKPHQGYSIANKWASMKNIKSAFSFTSNIDGHWIASGWDENQVFECHGSIHYMQCRDNCSSKIWPTDGALKLTVDPETDCVIDPLPTCPDCEKLARPNVLMFSDWECCHCRMTQQRLNYTDFLDDLRNTETKLLIIELGAGQAVPTVRIQSEDIFSDVDWKTDFIRINPSIEDAKIPDKCRSPHGGEMVEIALDALTALTEIDQVLQSSMNM